MLTGSEGRRDEAPARDAPTEPCPDSVWDVLDELMEQDADPATVLARVSSVLGRGVGLCTPDGVLLTAGPGGPAVRDTRPVPAGARCLPDGLRVWVVGPPGPAEDLLLRRLGVAVKVALRQPVKSVLPAVEAVFDHRRRPDARLDAARQLRLPGNTPLTVAALKGPVDGVRELASRIESAASVLCVYDDGKQLILVTLGLQDALPNLAVPVGVRMALANGTYAVDLPAAYRLVLLGLRYSLPATHDSVPYSKSEAVLVDTAVLGGYLLLPAYLTREQIDTVEDVLVLDRLWSAHGADMLRILEAVAATDSVRQAARLVYLHHNSVAYRVERAEQALGFTITEPYGRTRLFIALCLRRVRDSADG